MRRARIRTRARLATWVVLTVALVLIGCEARSSYTADAAPGNTSSLQRALSKHVPPPRDVPSHVQTAEYLWSQVERTTDPSTYAPYLTWAYPLYNQFGRVRQAGIKTVLYVNPLMPEPTNKYEWPVATREHPELLAKDCAGNPVRAYNGTSYLLDVLNGGAPSAVREMVNGYVGLVRSENRGSTDPISVLFFDNANSFYGVEPMPCNFDQDRWTSGVEAAASQAGYPVVLNTLSVRPKTVPSKVAAIHGSNVSGAMYEACFADTQWSAEELAQILTIRQLRRLHKPSGPGFWCYVNGKRGVGKAPDVTAQRLFQYASFLLTYDPKYSVYQTAYDSTPSTFRVLPETGFVPMEPVRQVTDISSLDAGNGAYAQLFRYCYYRGRLLGSCEVAVNPSTGVVELPNYGRYRHVATLYGGGVLDGGKMSFDTPVRADDMQPQSAAILVP